MQITTMLDSYSCDGMKFVVFNGYPGEQDLDRNTLGDQIVREFFNIDVQTNEIEHAEDWFESRQMAAMLRVTDKVMSMKKK